MTPRTIRRLLMLLLAGLLLLAPWLVDQTSGQAQPTLTSRVKRATASGLVVLAPGATVQPGDTLVYEALTNWEAPTAPATVTLTLDTTKVSPGGSGASGGQLVGSSTTRGSHTTAVPQDGGPGQVWWWSTVQASASGQLVFRATYAVNGQTLTSQVALNVQALGPQPTHRVHLPVVRR